MGDPCICLEVLVEFEHFDLIPARMSQDNLIKMECTTCHRVNYYSQKNKKTLKNRLELSKFCRWCKKHETHKETK
jgi:large subunit ribosomal protein L33